MKASPAKATDWHSFMKEPVLYIEPARFVACFEGSVPPALSRKMLTSRRLQSRLSLLIQAHYGLDPWIDPERLGEADRKVALLPFAELSDLVMRAGAIYWSAGISSAVLAKTVAALQGQLGDELFGYAIANRDLAGPQQSLEPLADVGSRIQADGWRCLAAWCDAVPSAVALRVKLKLPQDSIVDSPTPDTPVPPAFKDRGPDIIRRAAA